MLMVVDVPATSSPELGFELSEGNVMKAQTR